MWPARALATGMRLLSSGLLLLLANGAANPRADWATAGKPLQLRSDLLRVAVDASYPPFAVAESDGGLHGLEVDLARELGWRLGLQVELANTDVGGGLDALIGDQYDAILAGLTRSRDLEDRVAFSRPYFDDGPRLLSTRQGSFELDGRRVALELGSSADQAARRRLRAGARFDVLRLAEPDAVLSALLGGQAELALLDATSARQAAARSPGMSLAPAPFEPRPLSVALRRPNRALRFAVDEVLESMRAEGALERLASRWLDG